MTQHFNHLSCATTTRCCQDELNLGVNKHLLWLDSEEQTWRLPPLVCPGCHDVHNPPLSSINVGELT